MHIWNRKCPLWAAFLFVLLAKASSINNVEAETSSLFANSKNKRKDQLLSPGIDGDACPIFLDSFEITAPNVTTRLHTDTLVRINVTFRWSPGLRLWLVLLIDGYVYREKMFEPTGLCGQYMLRKFPIWNHANTRRTDLNQPSFKRRLDAIVSIGTNSAPDHTHCLNLLCKNFTLTYEFLPSPKKIVVNSYPPYIRAGDRGVIWCSVNDGNPAAEPFAIRIINQETGKLIMTVNQTELVLLSASAGKYQCLVLSRAFGQERILVSDMSLTVMGPRSNVNSESEVFFLPSSKLNKFLTNPSPEWLPSGWNDTMDRNHTHEVFFGAIESVADENLSSRAELVLGLLISTTLVLLLEQNL